MRVGRGVDVRDVDLVLAVADDAQLAGTGAGEDINRSWAPYPLTQTLWCGFRMKVPAGGAVTTTNGVYFLHFKDATTGFRARTGIRAPGAGGNFRLAVNADGTNLSLGANWPQDLMFDTDYFVVVNWNPTTGQSQMWVNPTSPASPSVSHTGTLVGNFMVGLALRQSTEYTGFIHVDNLFVGLSFADVVGPGASYTTFGAGCANSVGVASNTADSLPRTNTPWPRCRLATSSWSAAILAVMWRANGRGAHFNLKV